MYEFEPHELIDFATRLRDELAKGQEPLFWYRPVCDGEMYEGPIHNESILGKMMRDEKPDEWKPLYTHPFVAAPAGVPDGWKLVPAEPDIEMLEAGNAEMGRYVQDASPSGIYKAMLSAAPAAPADAVEKDAERYRWLRDHTYVDDGCLELSVNIYCRNDPNKADRDIAIDAAMQGKEQK